MTTTYLSRQLVTAIRLSPLTQRTIAKRVGVHEAMLSTWLCGRYITTEEYSERVRAIAELVGVPVEAAFSDTFDPAVAREKRAPRPKGDLDDDRETVSTMVPAALLEEFTDRCDELKVSLNTGLEYAIRGFVAAGKLAALRAEKHKCTTA
jgi:transcriptional regulator with XRE-family HTH domain